MRKEREARKTEEQTAMAILLRAWLEKKFPGVALTWAGVIQEDKKTRLYDIHRFFLGMEREAFYDIEAGTLLANGARID